MTTNSVLLSITNDRLHFWQSQLQSAFREGNEDRAATCGRVIAEYGLLIAEVMKLLHTSDQAGA